MNDLNVLFLSLGGIALASSVAVRFCRVFLN